MTFALFQERLLKLTALPQETVKEMIGLAVKLTTEDRETIIAHLEGIDADLRRSDERRSASVDRHGLMLRQVEEHDLPAYRALLADA